MQSKHWRASQLPHKNSIWDFTEKTFRLWLSTEVVTTNWGLRAEVIRSSLKCIKNNAVTQEMLTYCRLYCMYYRGHSQQRVPFSNLTPFLFIKKDASDLNHFAGVVVLLSAVLCFWGFLYKPRVLRCTRTITNTILAVSCLDVLFQPTKDSLTFCIFLDRAFRSTVLQQKLATLLWMM